MSATESADRPVQRSQTVEAVGHLDALNGTLSFLLSVIRCGEPLTPDVEQAVDNARTRLATVAAILDSSVVLDPEQHVVEYGTGNAKTLFVFPMRAEPERSTCAFNTGWMVVK